MYLVLIILNLFLLNSCNSQESPKIEMVNIAENKSTTQDIAKLNNFKQIDEENDKIYNTRQNAITRAVSRASDAVVGINITEIKKVVYRNSNPFGNDEFFGRFFRRYRSAPSVREYEVKGLGTGFVISPDGYILTNHHVAGSASKVIITLTDGTEHQAEIIGTDFTTDVALLKIDAKNLPYLKLANSEDIIIGEWVIALGNPFGLFDKNAKPTVTVGVVSNNGVDFVQEDNNEYRVYKDMIQTDAAISSGNSGGPLVNALGEVIGINTIIYSTATDGKGAGSIGIGFSIPINRVREIVNKLIDNKTLNRNFYTGLDVKLLDKKLQAYLKLDIDRGLIVYSILKNSPAFLSGLEPGDLILSINDRKIIDQEDFIISIYDNFVGDKINFRILRNGKELSKTLILVPRPGE